MKKWLVLTLLMAGMLMITFPASKGLAATKILLIPAQEYSVAGNTEAYHLIDQRLINNFKYPLNSIVHRYEMVSIEKTPVPMQPDPRSPKLTKPFLQELSKLSTADLVVVPQLTTFSRYETTNMEGDTFLQSIVSLRCFVYTAADDHFFKIETSRYYYNDYSPDQEPDTLLDQMLDETMRKLPYGVVADAKITESK